ncbi:MAG: 30S ribosomal protein S12 methylthiotransferase RimO [Clostridia bacterium]|nr:30S ribosomal protein S12 methylthiotransferase RimO [Clostridia bacterium]
MVVNKKVGVISLGCDKNRVDTEKMLAILSQKHTLTSDISEAQVIIVNTCAFLASSREEAIGEVLSASLYKDKGVCEKLIVTGCLPQKFIADIYDDLIEADAFLGVSDYAKINDVIDSVYLGDRVNAVGIPAGEPCKERVLTTSSYAYLKIADGCSNHCTYCLIPYIRGKFRSVPLADLVEEASSLGNLNELILVAQEVTRYGQDLAGNVNLITLIKELSKLDNVGAIRLLYCYPENITDDLILEFKTNPKLIKYIDIPLQHASDPVLKRMNRKGTGAGYLSLIENLKSNIPSIAIRSTFITGFPGETEEDFNNLLDFVAKAKLFNAGFFKYSREEGTPAYKMDGQLPQSVKEKRIRKLYALQRQVSKQNLKTFKGQTLSVTVEGFDEDDLLYYGRAYFNAPDIDGKVYFTAKNELCVGQVCQVKIARSTDYDLIGKMI